MPVELSNVRIEGEPAGTTEVTITLDPGQCRLLLLRQEKVRAHRAHVFGYAQRCHQSELDVVRGLMLAPPSLLAPQAGIAIKWFAKPEAKITEIDGVE